MLEPEVIDEIRSASLIRLFRRLLHEVKRAAVHDSRVLAERYFGLERPRAVLYPPRRRFWREIFHLNLRRGVLEIVVEHDKLSKSA